MNEILASILSSDKFIPHGHCYLWKPGLVWLHVITDSLVALSYFTIPFTIVYFVHKRRDIPFNWMFMAFAIFIVACGTTHLMGVWTVWNPSYWLSGIVKSVTAIASVTTAILLVRIIPDALAIPSPQELAIANSKLQEEITERKRAEEALRASEEKFRAVAETANDAIISADGRGNVIYFNKGAELIFGYSRSELIGKPLTLLMPDRFHDAHKHGLKRFLSTGEARVIGKTVELVGKRKDGTEFPVELSLASWKTDEGTFFSGILRDVTERKVAEEALQKAQVDLEKRVRERTAELETEITERTRVEEALKENLVLLSKKNRHEAVIRTVTQSVHQSIDLQDVLENAVEAMIVNIDKADNIGIYLVEGQEAVLKAHKGLTHWYLERAGRIPYSKGLTWKTIRDGKPRYCSDTDKDEFIGPAGKELGIKSYLSLPINFDEKTIGAININSFTKGALEEELGLIETVRKQIEIAVKNAKQTEALRQSEEEIRKINEELEKRVIERTRQLEMVNRELEAFSYSVSHDLRAPLRAIDGFSRILFEDYSDKIDDEGRRLLSVIRKNTQNMGQLIDDLLSFSRLGRQEMKLSEINMSELARIIFEEIKPNDPAHNLKLEINSLPPAYGDRAMIKQVFANLLSNAVKFSRKKEESIIEVGGRIEGIENLYYVRDNGVGFDMNYVDKLFGVFQRLHSQGEFEGTGVGLALVKRIIHRHGGRVWAEGQVGEGATFYFTLPGEGGIS
ncbi:MAG TPA: PAS domain S-box protein [Thermodesulfobacteriota bacterium]|nr:PAS domain S-box protein [Thermodesulfobacteriota bacterium]